MAELGIAPGEPIRMPLHLLDGELRGSDRIVALNEPEHRPILEARFPDQRERVEYWHIPDLNRMGADEALAAIEAEVRALVERLAAQRGERH